MMMTRRRWPDLLPAGLALAGVAAGHVLGYVVAVPDAHHRSRLLDQTGHGAWWAVIALAAIAASWSVAAVSRRAFRSRSTKPISWARLAIRLVCLQPVLFVILEAAERISVHGDASGISGRALAIGAAVQIVVALASAALVRSLAGVAAAAGRLWSAQPRLGAARRSIQRPATAFLPHAAGLAGAAGVRGPPGR